MTPSPSLTTLEAALANVLASTKVLVSNFNRDKKLLYLQGFENWTVSVLAGRIDNTNPPRPPMGYVVATGASGFAYPEIGNSPVCEMPEIPPDYSRPQVLQIGQVDAVSVPAAYLSRHKAGDVAMGAELFAMGIPAAAIGDFKSVWVRREHATPFGVTSFYLRVA